MNIIEGSRTKNATRNITFGVIYKVLNIIIPFITRTIMLYVLGTEFLGLNGLFSSILQVLNLAELGFSNAIIYSMYKPVAENDYKKISILLNYYKKVYKIIGIIVLILGVILLPFISYFINGTYPSGINIYIIYIITLANTCLTYFLYAYKNSLLIAGQREDILSKISAAILIIQNIVQAIVLLVFKNYYLYIIMLPICTIINNLIVSKYVDKKYPQIIKTNEKLDEENNLEIKKNIKGMFFQKIGGVVLSSVDYIVISSFLGLTILGLYSNYYYIITSLFAILTVILNSLKASVGNSIILESKEKNFNDLKKFNFIYLWIVSFCTISLLCLYQNFIHIWLGKEMMLSDTIVILFAIYFFVHKWFDMLYVYQEAKGLWWENRFVPFIAAIVNLVINIILVQYIGLSGILISTIISVLFIYDLGYMFILFKYYFNKKQMCEWLLQQCKYLLVTIFATIITYTLCHNIGEYNFINFLLRIIICLIVPNTIFLICYYKQTEFKSLIPLLKTILSKIKRMIDNKLKSILEPKRIKNSTNKFSIDDDLTNLLNTNKSVTINDIESIEIDCDNKKYKWVGAVYYNDKFYCIPNGTNKFLVYDIKKNDYNYIPIDEEENPFMWTGGCEYLGKIYAFPRTSNKLLSLDTKNNQVELINLKLKYHKEHHYGGVATENGIIYQPPRNSSHILKIDLNKKEAKKIYILPKLLGIKYNYTTGIIHTNNNIYFFPEQNGHIMVLNIDTEEITFMKEKLSSMVFDAAISENGNIYGFSAYEKGILKIDVKNGTSKMIHQEIGIPGCYGTKLGINGKIYGIPGNGNKIYEYDPKTEKVTIIKTLEEKKDAKCAGGIITKDGTIYTVPALGNKIYKYNFKNVKKEINDKLLNSNYFEDNY